MISSNNNPLFSLTNYSVPLTTNLATNLLNRPLDQSKASCQDLIFNYLIGEGIIDASGCLLINSKNLDVPTLGKEQLERLNELLTTPFQIKSKSNNFFFEITICLKDLFAYLNLDKSSERSIEIVGGSVFWILGEEYMRKVCKLLNIPEELITEELLSDFKTKAADVDIRMWGVKDPDFEKLRVCYFLASYLPATFNKMTLTEKAQLIKEYGFSNFFTPFPDLTDDRFGMVSFGERHSFSVDLMFLGSLKRKNLFKHDAVKIVLSDLNGSQNSPTIQSSSESVLESLILKLTKILSADKVEEIDTPGSTKLFMHLTKGWRYVSESLEKILLDNFFKSWKYSLLTKLVDNHFPTEKFAAEALCFNVCSLVPENNLIVNVSKSLLPKPLTDNEIEDSPLTLFQAAMSELNPINFELITAYFQIFGLLVTPSRHPQELEVLKTKINRESFLQIKFNNLQKALHLNVKDDLNSGLISFKNHIEQFKKTSLPQIFQVLSKYFIRPQETLKISEIKVESHGDLIEVASKAAFDLLDEVNADNNFINQMGFYLLCYAGIIERNSNYFTHLLLKLPDLLINENSPSIRKNLSYSLVKYWLTTDKKEILWKHSEKIEAFYEVAAKKDAEPLKLFCLTFSEFEIPSLTGFIFKTWETNPELFDFESSCQLMKSIKRHDPYTALKILKKLAESKGDNEKLKKYFDVIINEYARAENKLIATRDFSLISDIAEEIMANMSPFKQLPKQEEMASYITFIRKLMSIDFERGAKIIKTLEEKKALAKGFNSVLQNASDEDKIWFTLQFNKNNPIDLKSNATAIQERLELLIQAVSSDFDTDLLKELAEEICKVLAIYFKSKKGSASKIKDILKPKLERILRWLLTDHKKQETPNETVLFYFQIVDTLAVEASLALQLLPKLLMIFNEILQKSSNPLTEIDFIKAHLPKLPFRKAVIPEEQQLYHHMVKLLIEGEHTDTATDFLKKILKYSTLNSEIMNLVFSCFDQYIEKQNADKALSLLEWIKKPFPESPLINDSIRLKKLILGLNEKQVLKKLEILTAKPEFFLDDESILKEVEQLVLFLLKNQTLLKDKGIDPVLKLIKTYRLTQASVVTYLGDYFKPSKDKKLIESTFLMLQEMGLTFTHLSPLIHPLNLVNSAIILNFLEHYEEVVNAHQGDQKKELIQDFILGFLNLLKIGSVHVLKVQMAIVFLENELNCCNLGVLEKQTEIDLKYVRIFTSLATQDDLFINLMVWEKLKSLALKVKKNEVTEVLQLFTKAMSLFKNLETLFEADIIEFLENIKAKVTPLQMIPYFDYLNLYPSLNLLKLNVYFAVAIVESCPTEKVERLSGPYLKFKPALKKIIDMCIEKCEFFNLPALVTLPFFTWKEIFYYKGKISSVIFNKPDGIKSVELITDALSLYIDNLESPEECPEFQEENLKSSISFLLALVFNHNEPDIYIDKLCKITQKLFCYLEPVEANFPRNLYPYLNMGNIVLKLKVPQKEKLLMRKKIYNFLFHLTEALTVKLVENRYELNELILKISSANLVHISLMSKFSDKNEETISAALNYCYATTFMPNREQKLNYDNIKIIIRQMNERKSFLDTSTISKVKNSFKLVAFAYLPITWFPLLSNEFKAEMILDMIKKISSFEHEYSTFKAFQYSNFYGEHLNSSIKEEATIYFKQLVESVKQNDLEEQQDLERFAELVLLEGIEDPGIFNRIGGEKKES